VPGAWIKEKEAREAAATEANGEAAESAEPSTEPSAG
jgi:hypothetical protein